MSMKTPEYFRTLWTERFSRNDLNGLYGTKRFENETERFGDGTKRFENETKRNVLVTERNALRTERFWGVVVHFRICTVKPVYSKTCLLRHLCNLFYCVIGHEIWSPFNPFLCFVIHCVVWYLDNYYGGRNVQICHLVYV